MKSTPGEARHSPTDLVATAGKWLLALTFLTLPLNTLRPVRGIALADLVIPLLFLAAFVLFLARASVRKSVFQLPGWLWLGSGILVLSIGLIELFPPGDLGPLVSAFDTYGVEESKSVVVGSRLLIALVIFPVVVGLLVDRWATIRLLVDAWIIGVTISCVVVVLDTFFGFGIQKALAFDPTTIAIYLDQSTGDPARQVGLTDHPNTLGLIAAMVSPMVLAKMESRRGLVTYGPVLMLLTLGIVASGSRTALIVLAVGFALMVGLDERFRRTLGSLRIWTKLAMLVGFVAVVALFSVAASAPESDVGNSDSGPASAVPSGLDRTFNPGGVSATYANNEREAWIRDSLEFISERPLLGHGFQWVEASHNTVLQLLLSGGVIALVGFFVVIGGYLKLGFGLRSRIPKDLENTCVALAISLVLYLVSGLTTNHIFQRYLYIPAGLILALYVLQKNGSGDYPASRDA